MSTFPFTTVRDCLRYAVSRFNEFECVFGHGSQTALDEAAYLILHTLKLPLDQLDPFLDAKLLPAEISAVLKIIDRRCHDRLPAAYITQEAWLTGARFYVDERVIVPRSLIAELIPHHFSPWITNPDTVREVLDVCTGSGCLAILLAEAFPNAHVDATDISIDALAVAFRNRNDYGLQKRLTLIESNLYERVPATKQYDVIVSNPPYVNSESMRHLPPEYLHEPALALAGGEDGMDCVRTLITEAKNHLTENGILIIEVGHERAFVEAALPGLPAVWLSTSAGDDQVFLLTADQL